MSITIKERLLEDMKTAMRGQDKRRLGIIRLIQAAVKQREVDERINLEDAQVIAVLDKMSKQRQDSHSQFQAAGRMDLADQELFEIDVINEYLPAPLSQEEINTLIVQAIANSNAHSMADMNKVMTLLKPELQGRADMGAVSRQIKEKLSS